MEINPFERQLIDLLLAGDAPDLSLLRAQLAVADVSKRDFTGIGFFTRFEVPTDVQRLDAGRSLRLGNAAADIKGLAHGAGFILFVDHGALNFLEGFSYDEPWPVTIKNFRVYAPNPSKSEI